MTACYSCSSCRACSVHVHVGFDRSVTHSVKSINGPMVQPRTREAVQPRSSRRAPGAPPSNRGPLQGITIRRDTLTQTRTRSIDLGDRTVGDQNTQVTVTGLCCERRKATAARLHCSSASLGHCLALKSQSWRALLCTFARVRGPVAPLGRWPLVRRAPNSVGWVDSVPTDASQRSFRAVDQRAALPAQGKDTPRRVGPVGRPLILLCVNCDPGAYPTRPTTP